MNIAFYTWNKPRKKELMISMSDGARKFGHHVSLFGPFTGVEPYIDVAVFMGCNLVVKEALEAYAQAGKNYIYVDKGYLRYEEQGLKEPIDFYRVSVNCFQPVDYVVELGESLGSKRWERLRIKPFPWKTGNGDLIYADTSNKYKDWFGLTERNVADDLLDLNETSKRRVVYRSRGEASKIYDQLPNACALATRGSNAAVDAILYGVPVCLLGTGLCISRPLSRSIEEIFLGNLPSEEQRMVWLWGLAWCQFTLAELSCSSVAWKTITERLKS